MKHAHKRSAQQKRRMLIAAFILTAVIFMLLGPKLKATEPLPDGLALLQVNSNLLILLKSLLTA
ncbi:MAG: hypothetical protein LW707_10040 [Sphingobacteriales bacterium]|jgi:hypothetical protein|nr:hypothetical protein [Sphingobacteriales bacterium]